MRAKQRYIKQWFVFLLCVLPVSFGITAQNQTLLNHKRSRNLNREGYRAYQVGNWAQALLKFSQSMELDPYYTYPVYNSACVLSLRGRPQDSYRIYRLLLEVLLQESGEVRSIHQAKMQKDPDLAWFRRSEPELFILLNNVVPNYDSQKIYQKLRKPQSWNIELGTTFGKQAMTEYEFLNEEPDSAESNNSDFMFKPTETVEDKELDIGYIVPPEERKNSLTVTPDDELFRFEDSDDLELSRAEQANRNKKIARESLFRELDSFLDSRNLFADPDIELQEFSKFDTEEVRDGFVPFVPQSLREQYQESEFRFSLVSQQVRTKTMEKDTIVFEGYRYTWRFQIDSRLFEMQGFFVIRGNVLILETFASHPKELENLPFDWEAFRSLFFIYQPEINEFQAVIPGDKIRIY